MGLGDWGKLDPSEPRNRRTRASIVIETSENKRILVDTGPDLRLQLTQNGIGRIEAIIYTHTHADHIAGLDEVRILNRLLAGPMPAYARAESFADLRERFGYAFKPFSGGFFMRPVLEPHVVTGGEVVDIAGIPIRFIEQDHRLWQFAWVGALKISPNCTDVVRLDDAALSALHGLDVFVVDCFTKARVHQTHANLDRVLEWVEILRPRHTILTHMGPEMDYGTLRQSLPAGVEPGYDGLQIRL